jgi:hypothetical protein
MIAIDFPEVTHRIGEGQEDTYNPIPAKITLRKGIMDIVMCFKLEQGEIDQVKESGEIWLTIRKPKDHYFHPIGPNCLKPSFTDETQIDI